MLCAEAKAYTRRCRLTLQAYCGGEMIVTMVPKLTRETVSVPLMTSTLTVMLSSVGAPGCSAGPSSVVNISPSSKSASSCKKNKKLNAGRQSLQALLTKEQPKVVAPSVLAKDNSTPKFTTDLDYILIFHTSF